MTTTRRATDAGYEELEARLREHWLDASRANIEGASLGVYVNLLDELANALADMRRQLDEAQADCGQAIEMCEATNETARTYAAQWEAAERERDRYKALADGERTRCAKRAREIADHYPLSSDGRNTFVMFAEWIEALPAPEERQPTDKEPSDDDGPDEGNECPLCGRTEEHTHGM